MIEKTSATTFTETTEVVVVHDIKEMEYRLSCWKDARAQDMNDLSELETLRTELDKTSLPEDEKTRLIDLARKSPHGITDIQIAELENEIAILKSL